LGRGVRRAIFLLLISFSSSRWAFLPPSACRIPYLQALFSVQAKKWQMGFASIM
jgi:hypothetical protein